MGKKIKQAIQGPSVHWTCCAPAGIATAHCRRLSATAATPLPSFQRTSARRWREAELCKIRGSRKSEEEAWPTDSIRGADSFKDDRLNGGPQGWTGHPKDGGQPLCSRNELTARGPTHVESRSRKAGTHLGQPFSSTSHRVRGVQAHHQWPTPLTGQPRSPAGQRAG